MTVWLMSDGELRRLEVLQDLDQRRLTTVAAVQLLGLEPHCSHRGASLEWRGPRKRGCVGRANRQSWLNRMRDYGRQTSHLGPIPDSKRRPRCR